MKAKFRIPWQLKRKDSGLEDALKNLPLEARLKVRHKNLTLPPYSFGTTSYIKGMNFQISYDSARVYVVSPILTSDIKEINGYVRAKYDGVHPSEVTFESTTEQALTVQFRGRDFHLYFGDSKFIKHKS
jgi:hypothetical protein